MRRLRTWLPRGVVVRAPKLPGAMALMVELVRADDDELSRRPADDAAMAEIVELTRALIVESTVLVEYIARSGCESSGNLEKWRRQLGEVAAAVG